MSMKNGESRNQNKNPQGENYVQKLRAYSLQFSTVKTLPESSGLKLEKL